MALSLADGLIEVENSKIVNPDLIANHYAIWYNSEPFDIGMTTRNALR